MSLRGKVLGSYRLLLRACRDLCQDDVTALKRAHAKIRDEYKTHQNVDNEAKIEELICKAVDAEKFLRQNVVQVVPIKDDLYKLRITEDTVLSDNPIPPTTPPT